MHAEDGDCFLYKYAGTETHTEEAEGYWSAGRTCMPCLEYGGWCIATISSG